MRKKHAFTAPLPIKFCEAIKFANNPYKADVIAGAFTLSPCVFRDPELELRGGVASIHTETRTFS